VLIHGIQYVHPDLIVRIINVHLKIIVCVKLTNAKMDMIIWFQMELVIYFLLIIK